MQWEYKPIGELTINLDHKRIPLSKRERAKRPGPYPYYGATGIMDYIDDFLFDGLHLLIAEDGSVERPDGKPFVQLVAGKFWVNNHAHVLQGYTKTDTRYLYYALSQVQIRPYLTGSVQPKLNQGNLNRILVPWPPKNERRTIAHILGTLDDKIELLRRMSETLEETARAIFKAWFVDFVPVRAKMEGRWKRGQSLPGLPAHLYDLFPDRLVPSELGEIPEGWEVVSLIDLFDINPPRSLPRGQVAPYLDMANMPTRGHVPETVTERRYTGSGTRFINGDTLLARITPSLENGKTAFVDFLKEGQVGWGSTEYIVLRPKPPLPELFAYCLARNEDFREFAIQSMTGTSGRQRVQPSALAHYRLVCPPAMLAQRFGDVANSLFARAKTAMEETRTLAALRDALLPKLVSGEVRVKDAKRFIQEKGT